MRIELMIQFNNGKDDVSPVFLIKHFRTRKGYSQVTTLNGTTENLLLHEVEPRTWKWIVYGKPYRDYQLSIGDPETLVPSVVFNHGVNKSLYEAFVHHVVEGNPIQSSLPPLASFLRSEED